MKTDELLYELVRLDPTSVFRLVQLDLEGEYAFESITLKTIEKRIDGFLKRTDGPGPNVFVEFQGWDDPKIYWRSFREVYMFYEERDDPAPFILIVVFIDSKYDPGHPPITQVEPPNQFIRLNLIDALNAVTQPGILTVLKPLVFPKDAVIDHIQEWKAEVTSLPLPEDKIQKIIELLEFAVWQKLPNLSLKEVRNMIQLTPLEETVAGKELIQIGWQRGQREGLKTGQKKGQETGIKKGEMIGEIRATQRMLNTSVSPIKELEKKGMTTLRKILQHFKAEEEEKEQKLELVGEIRLAQRILKQPVSTKDDLMEHSPEDLDAIFQDLQTELAKLN